MQKKKDSHIFFPFHQKVSLSERGLLQEFVLSHFGKKKWGVVTDDFDKKTSRKSNNFSQKHPVDKS